MGEGEDLEERAVAPLLLWLLFILYPVVTNVAFEAFPCHELDGGVGWLIADVAIDCESDEHVTVQLLAWLAIVVYPIGMWVLAASLLFKIRDDVNEGRESKLRAATAFLHKEYVPTAYWWELAEMLRRFILIGVFVIIEPGTITQSEQSRSRTCCALRAQVPVPGRAFAL